MTPTRRSLSPVLAALLALIAATARGEEEERSPGRITLSDGTVLAGDIRTTAGKPLRLFEEGTGRRLDLRIPEIYRIEVFVDQEEEYRKWRWVEDGSREKVYTGESYPKRAYSTEIVLRSGQVHRGGVVAVLYVYPEGASKPKKVFLKKGEQGEIGETLDDLVYVESVQFMGKPPDPGAGEAGIDLMVTPAEELYDAHALPRERDRGVLASFGLVPGLARFSGLLPGTYDLAVVARDEVYLWLAVGKDGGRPLTPEETAEVQNRVSEVADFFEKREVLAGVREGDRVRVVVQKSRTGATSMGGKLVFRRIEVWSMHRGGDRWLIDNRSYISREHGEELPPPREVILIRELGGVRVDAGVSEVDFAVPRRDE